MSASKLLKAVTGQRIELGILGTVMCLISFLGCLFFDYLSSTTTLSGRNIKSPRARCLRGENCVTA